MHETQGIEPELQQLLLKLHKGAAAGFNAKTTQLVLGLFPGWGMVKQDFIKASDDIGWNDLGFRGLTTIMLNGSKRSLYASSRRTEHPTRLVESRSDEADAKALHEKVAEYVVAELPEPKRAKPDQYFVMNLTAPVAVLDKDGDTDWVWSFDLFRKCKGYRITAPDGQHFDVCGPTKVLGYGGTQDFGAFFKWALANTDLEASVNAALGLAKHVKASERPRVAVGDQIIGHCAICMNGQVVRNGVMVLHGYQRPGHGYIIGNCFGIAYPPYETSAKACVAYIPVLENLKAHYEDRLAALKSGAITKLTETKHNYKTGRDERIVIEKGDPKFDGMLSQQIAEGERQIGYIVADIAAMQRRIVEWQPGTLRCSEVKA